MEKFELDAFTETHPKKGALGSEAPPPSSSAKAEQDARDAAAAIAGIDAIAALDAIVPTENGGMGLTKDPAAAAAKNGGVVDLPARPFEPRRAEGGGAHAEPVTDLPARPFEPRRDVDAEAAAPTPAPMATPTATAETSSPTATPAAESGAFGEWVPPQAGEHGPSSSGREAAAPTPEELRTQLARKFVSLADSVTEAFREFAIGAGAWAVELTAPQGMSTGGGKQALQHLRFRPRREGYSVFVAGTVNQVDRRAELRDYDHVTIMHEVRFRHALEISNQEWEQFLRKAEVVLNGAGIQSMRTPPPRDLLEQRRSMQRVSKGAVFALVVVLLLAAIVLWRVVIALNAG